MKSSLFWTDTAELAELLSRVGGGSGRPRPAPRRAPEAAAEPTPASAAEPTPPSAAEPTPAPAAEPTPAPAAEPTPAGTVGRAPSFARQVNPVVDRSDAVPAASEPPPAPAPLPPAGEAGSADLDGELPAGSVEERLDALLRRVVEHTGAGTVFVVGEDGLAVAGQESAAPELVAAAAVLAQSWESLRERFALAPFHAFAVSVGEGRRLEVLSSSTSWGRLSLGFIPERPVDKNDISALRRMLERALQEKEKASS